MPDGSFRGGRLEPETDPAIIEERLLSEIARRRSCRRSFLDYATEMMALVDQEPARHHRLICEELEAVDRGETDRLMLFCPPGHAKTTYASILFPAYFLRKTGRNVIGASYNSEFAENDVSSPILRNLQENGPILGYGLRSDSRKIWRTDNRGVYRAAGAGSGITGRRADLFIIDDPIKGREQADSETYRDKVWKWYRAEVITRLKPGARIVLILTRWHEDDLAGRLLDAAKEEGAAPWKVLSMPAIAEGDNDILGRRPGEALWPEWEDEVHLRRKRQESGEREWASLFQQRPAPLEGALFKIAMIPTLLAEPAGGMTCRAWDLAATKQVGSRNPDWTVGVKLKRDPTGRYIVCDVTRLRGGPDEVKAAIVNTAAQDGNTVRISLPQDPGQAGKVQVLDLTRALSGFRVESSPETGDKATRAAPVASQANVGNLSVVEGAWKRTFLDELAGFPSAAKDDQVDALSRAFSVVGMKAGPTKIDPGVLARSRRRTR